jgi:hypothetical protein
MKSLVLAALIMMAYVIVVIVVLRLWPGGRRAAAMTTGFLATVPIFVAVHLLSPPDLGVLPPALAEPHDSASLVFGLLVYTAGFFGGVLQIYNLAERGFSLRILIDIDENGGPVTVDEIRKAYSRGSGLEWMYDKRIRDLLDHGLIALDGATVRVTKRGERVGAVFARLRTMLRAERGT